MWWRYDVTEPQLEFWAWVLSATSRSESSRVGSSDLSPCLLWPHPCQIPVGILGQECNLAWNCSVKCKAINHNNIQRFTPNTLFLWHSSPMDRSLEMNDSKRYRCHESYFFGLLFVAFWEIGSVIRPCSCLDKIRKPDVGASQRTDVNNCHITRRLTSGSSKESQKNMSASYSTTSCLFMSGTFPNIAGQSWSLGVRQGRVCVWICSVSLHSLSLQQDGI